MKSPKRLCNINTHNTIKKATDGGDIKGSPTAPEVVTHSNSTETQKNIRIGVFFDCLSLSVRTYVNQNSAAFKSDQQPVRPAICCCSQATSLMPTRATITTSWSVTVRKKPDGRTPARVCFPQGWPPWSSAVSRHTPCCSGSLAGKLWQPGVNKNNSMQQSAARTWNNSPSAYNILSTLTWMK